MNVMEHTYNTPSAHTAIVPTNTSSHPCHASKQTFEQNRVYKSAASQLSTTELVR